MSSVLVLMVSSLLISKYKTVYSAEWINEPVQACVLAPDAVLTDAIRAKFAQCLGWIADEQAPICQGSYQPINSTPIETPEAVHILADSISFFQNQRSTLSGHLEIRQNQTIVHAQTAYVYRNAKTNEITQIELLGNVRYLEPDKLMIAKRAVLNPKDNSGLTESVLYRFNTDRSRAILPAWGRASQIQRFANKNYLLKKVSYTTCAPKDKVWDLQADSIIVQDKEAKAVARNALLRIHEWPVLYVPYLSFPTKKERKSGFLLPIGGYSNVGGLDLGWPYYWNIAPNYDMTLVPHLYTKRGLMMGGEYRFLTHKSSGLFTGTYLPKDRAFGNFIQNNEAQFPWLRNNSTNRWSYGVIETTNLTPNLQFHANVQQVSDDYYLQDFSTNLALITQRQLLRQADLTYFTDHWTFRGMGQSYHTLQPINEVPIVPVYERLPQLMAQGSYYNLPFNAHLGILGQYDQFYWPSYFWLNTPDTMPEGGRVHFNPVLSIPFTQPWGYVTPSVQFVENYYDVNNNFFPLNSNGLINKSTFASFNFNRTRTGSMDFNRVIPRYSLDNALYFERDIHGYGGAYTQTLEPRLFYLRVPYQNQAPIPVYDSAYMIFNVDQLFRTNRFSGYDRIGDANQLTYALTSRWLSEESGAEFASFSMGQIKYFSDRKVQLCQSPMGYCLDNPQTFGYLSPISGSSPIASRAVYQFNSRWGLSGDYVWDPATSATNNADLNLHYQPLPNAVINFGYTYLINAEDRLIKQNWTQQNDFHQAIISFAWPMNEKWSTLGAFSYNISKNYSMMSLLGLQYDSCCWAMRVLGGRTFKNLNASFGPMYNDNVSLQLVLKGLGTVAYSDPSNILSTYIPGYNDPFSH